MMLDSKAPTYAVRGTFSDIVAAGWEVKRRRLLAAHLAQHAARARRADRLRLGSMALVLLLAFLSQACAQKEFTRHQRPAWHRVAFHDPEPPRPDTAFFRL